MTLLLWLHHTFYAHIIYCVNYIAYLIILHHLLYYTIYIYSKRICFYHFTIYGWHFSMSIYLTRNLFKYNWHNQSLDCGHLGCFQFFTIKITLLWASLLTYLWQLSEFLTAFLLNYFFFYTLPPLWIYPTCHSPSPDFASSLKNQTIWFTVGNLTAHPSFHSSLIMGKTLMPSDSATIWGGEGGAAAPALLQSTPVPSSGRNHPLPNPRCPHWKPASLVGDKSPWKALFFSALLRAHGKPTATELEIVMTPMKVNLVSKEPLKSPRHVWTVPNLPSHLTCKMKGLEIHPCPFHF